MAEIDIGDMLLAVMALMALVVLINVIFRR
jgi:hypothetical protein